MKSTDDDATGDEEFTVEEAGEALEECYTDLIEENAEMFRVARESALVLFRVADKHEEMAALAREAATIQLIMAKVSAGSLSDLLEGQFNLKVDEQEVIDDDDEDEPPVVTS